MTFCRFFPHFLLVFAHFLLNFCTISGHQVVNGTGCSQSALGLAVFAVSWTGFVSSLFWVRWRIQRRFSIGTHPGMWSLTLLCCGCYACTLTQEERHIKWELEGPPRRDLPPSPDRSLADAEEGVGRRGALVTEALP